LDALRGIWILEARLRAGWCEVRGSPAEEEAERRGGEERRRMRRLEMSRGTLQLQLWAGEVLRRKRSTVSL
jgi:hypothetical protein